MQLDPAITLQSRRCTTTQVLIFITYGVLQPLGLIHKPCSQGWVHSKLKSKINIQHRNARIEECIKCGYHNSLTSSLRFAVIGSISIRNSEAGHEAPWSCMLRTSPQKPCNRVTSPRHTGSAFMATPSRQCVSTAQVATLTGDHT